MFPLVNNKHTERNHFICAALFETTPHCFCWLSFLVWLRKKGFAFWYFFNEIFLPGRMPTFRGQKVVNMSVTRVSHSCLLIELGPICNSMAASLWFKRCGTWLYRFLIFTPLLTLRTTDYLKAVMEVFRKTFTAMGPIPEMRFWIYEKRCIQNCKRKDFNGFAWYKRMST